MSAGNSGKHSESASSGWTEEVVDSDSMKRNAARLIERYYYQLRDGCGDPSCTNPHCASSGQKIHLTPNEAAATALDLVKTKAKLCGDHRAKIARTEEPTGQLKHSQSWSERKDGQEGSTSKPNSSRSKPMELCYLTEERFFRIVEECEKENCYSLLRRTLGEVFSSPDALNKSFLKSESSVKSLSLNSLNLSQIKSSKEQVHGDVVMEDLEESTEKEKSKEEKRKEFLSSDELSVDLEALGRVYKKLFSLPQGEYESALVNGLILLSETAMIDLQYKKAFDRDVNYANMFIIFMDIPVLSNSEYIDVAFPTFCKAATYLPVPAQAKLVRVWASHSKMKLKYMVNALQQIITERVIKGSFTSSYAVNDETKITTATQLMKLLYYASILAGKLDPPSSCVEEEAVQDSLNELELGMKSGTPPPPDPFEELLGVKVLASNEPVVPFSDFYNEPLSEQIEMDRDFKNYRSKENRFSFMNYPFILTPATKATGLYYDNRIRMLNERRMNVIQSMVQGAPPNPYLRLKVRRENIIDDALVALEMAALEAPNDLKKQLVVEFEGEQGIDEGGVSKEFFQLVVEELFNPDIGMFTVNEETSEHWFNPLCLESDQQFMLIGIVLGLAIYNNIILDIHFPLVVYKKLMGKKGTFEDLRQWSPSLANGLKELQECEGDIEEVFMTTFKIGFTDVFGNAITHELKEGGENIMVNQENKQEFCELYADFLLNKRVEKQFNAFRRGFRMVTEESPLSVLFRPDEVELLVCGAQNFDFGALEEATEYDGGYTYDSPCVRAFWDIVHSMSLEEKRKLLQFTTGSDRVPVGGLSRLRLVIARHGPDTDRLPTAHTCFNVLLLPEYSSKAKLKDRLLKAISYSKGFGML